MSRLALGTVQFGLPYGIANQAGQVSQAEAQLMLKFAKDNGINTLDTAIAYGESEARLGEIGVADFKLVTKLPGIPKGCLDVGEWVSEQVDASMSRLNVSNIYGLLLHRSDDLISPNGRNLFQALQLLKEKGLVNKIGVSIYSPDELELLIADYSFDLVQAPFNLIDRRLLNSGWIRRLKDSGVEIHARSAFLQGLLLMKKIDIPPKFSPWNSILRSWHEWLQETNISALQASLGFALSFPEIDRVVVGAESQSQLLEIVNASNNLLNNDIPNLVCADENLINPANWSKL